MCIYVDVCVCVCVSVSDTGNEILGFKHPFSLSIKKKWNLQTSSAFLIDLNAVIESNLCTDCQWQNNLTCNIEGTVLRHSV